MNVGFDFLSLVHSVFVASTEISGMFSHGTIWNSEIECLTSLFTLYEHSPGDARQAVSMSQTVYGENAQIHGVR